jgi:hypothetical protein
MGSTRAGSAGAGPCRLAADLVLVPGRAIDYQQSVSREAPGNAEHTGNGAGRILNRARFGRWRGSRKPGGTAPTDRASSGTPDGLEWRAHRAVRGQVTCFPLSVFSK